MNLRSAGRWARRPPRSQLQERTDVQDPHHHRRQAREVEEDPCGAFGLDALVSTEGNNTLWHSQHGRLHIGGDRYSIFDRSFRSLCVSLLRNSSILCGCWGRRLGPLACSGHVAPMLGRLGRQLPLPLWHIGQSP